MRPYDLIPSDWISALFQFDLSPQKKIVFSVVL